MKTRYLIEEKRQASENAMRPKQLYEEADAALDDGDAETAFKKYRQAAKLGYPAAFGSLGFLYEFGEGVEQDDEKTKRWYKRGMDKNDGDSFGFYAKMIETEKIIDHGELTEEETAEIFDFRKKAVKFSGLSMFHYDLGQMYRHGSGTEKNLQKAFECFEKGSESGDYRCTNVLGVMYSGGEYVDKNPAKAVELYKKAVDGGNVIAMKNLALYYLDGDIVEKDERKVFELYKQAAQEGDIDAMNTVGKMYYSGKGVSQNYNEAFEWTKKAADEGNAWGMYNLAKMYRNGRGTSKNISKAIELYNKAAELGNSSAMVDLGEIYRDGDGMNYLGLLYDWGHGVAEDKKLALQI